MTIRERVRKVLYALAIYPLFVTVVVGNLDGLVAVTKANSVAAFSAWLLLVLGSLLYFASVTQEINNETDFWAVMIVYALACASFAGVGQLTNSWLYQFITRPIG